jgi:hypothetical protein
MARSPAADLGARYPHGADDLPAVRVDACSAELGDPGEGFVGDRASNRSFMAILEDWRERARRGSGEDPFADAVGAATPTHEIDRDRLDDLLHAARDDPEAAGLVHSAIEDFAQEAADVVRRFLRLPEWHGTERIAVGGGFIEAQVGVVAIGRIGILLKASGASIELVPVSREPDEAALCGAAHLVRPDAFAGKGFILAVDIGGTNIRVGLVELRLDRAPDLSQARVAAWERWRHADGQPGRDEAVDRLADMLRKLAGHARHADMPLAPFVGIACPGVVRPDGTIERGAQNLPGGNWEGPGFNLPARLAEALPEIGGRPPLIVLHNDAVVQGLSEVHVMQDVRRWGVLTIGTGLGNARFTNHGREG